MGVFRLFSAASGSASWILFAAVAVLVGYRVRTARARAYAAAIGAVLLLLTLRPAASAVAAMAIVIGLNRASRLKFKYMHMALHAHDLVHFFRNGANVRVFFKNYRSLTVSIGAAALGAVVAVSVAVSWERPKITRAEAAIVCLPAILTAAAMRRRAGADMWKFFDKQGHFLNFMDSISDSLRAAHLGGVLALKPPDLETPALAGAIAPQPQGEASWPTVLLIQNESIFPPGLFAPAAPDPEIASFFRSGDAREYRLRVETFGGGTWKTEFSVLTGIPVSGYGPFADHVLHWAAGKLHHSLPRTLARLGYRMAFFNAGLKEFVGSERFLKSLGFDELYDHRDYGIQGDRAPDRCYFRQALDWLERKKHDPSNLDFIYIQTMWNHYPHDLSYGIVNGRVKHSKINGSQFSEYIRRLKDSCIDYKWLRSELTTRFPDRPFIIVRFGDHQPLFTADRSAAIESEIPDADYLTFFAIDAVNFVPVADPEAPDTIEAAYLGNVILRAAGLPLDPVHAARRELMIRHEGKLFFADDHGDIAARFNGRLVAAGLVTPH